MELKKIFIAGAGTMGYSIAEIFAEYMYSVTLYDINNDALKKAKENIFQDKPEIIENELINFSSDENSFKDADLVIECIIEDLGTKQKFYEKISQIVKPDTILATNTSGISINEISKSVKHPERFLGMHWFNPSHLILLIEIIKGEKTEDYIAKTIHDLCICINKKPVVVKKDVPGFVANRIQFAILRESLCLIEDGVVDEEGIDDIMKYGLGFRYACAGPLEVADFGGLDVFYHISEYLMQDLYSDSGVPPLLEKLYKNHDYGVKTGKGFYDYSHGKDKKAVMERNRKLRLLFDSFYKNDRVK